MLGTVAPSGTSGGGASTNSSGGGRTHGRTNHHHRIPLFELLSLRDSDGSGGSFV
ncbi:hypothetical protein PIB30_098859 [Stylosanthes scabra]|uniref:Uncharacterized protein n=1 Tax=Stylosanthes scabra TaxID=79078 RepID=A0ABU6RXE3_9FABA|nr:hypothetical protein [Stylosanthes scabra]